MTVAMSSKTNKQMLIVFLVDYSILSSLFFALIKLPKIIVVDFIYDIDFFEMHFIYYLSSSSEFSNK